jgi:hypothetical protein
MHLHGMRNNFRTAHFTVENFLTLSKELIQTGGQRKLRDSASGDRACCLLRQRRKPSAGGVGLVLVQLLEDAEELAQCDPRSVLVEEDPTRRAQISMVTSPVMRGVAVSYSLVVRTVHAEGKSMVNAHTVWKMLFSRNPPNV